MVTLGLSRISTSFPVVGGYLRPTIPLQVLCLIAITYSSFFSPETVVKTLHWVYKVKRHLNKFKSDMIPWWVAGSRSAVKTPETIEELFRKEIIVFSVSYSP